MSLSSSCGDFGYEIDANSFIPLHKHLERDKKESWEAEGESHPNNTGNSDTSIHKFKKKPVRFSCANDILLLKAVISVNPYSTLNQRPKWEEVAEKLRENYAVDGRRCRERTTLILNYYVNDDTSAFRKVGKEEDLKLRDKLLGQLHELRGVSEAVAYTSKSSKGHKEGDLERNLESYTASVEERNVLSSSSSDENKDAPTAKLKRKRKKEFVANYLEKKHAAELALRKEELGLKKIELAQEQQRLNMEREKFEMEKKEKFARLEMDLEIKRIERDERKAMAELIKDLIKRQNFPVPFHEENSEEIRPN